MADADRVRILIVDASPKPFPLILEQLSNCETAAVRLFQHSRDVAPAVFASLEQGLHLVVVSSQKRTTKCSGTRLVCALRSGGFMGWFGLWSNDLDEPRFLAKSARIGVDVPLASFSDLQKFLLPVCFYFRHFLSLISCAVSDVLL
jgi:hypothetical protein